MECGTRAADTSHAEVSMTARDYRAPDLFDPTASLLSADTIAEIEKTPDSVLARIVAMEPLAMVSPHEVEFINRCALVLASRKMRRDRQSASTQPRMEAVRP